MDSVTLRAGLACFATGIATVTTRRPDGSPVGVTVNSFSSLSMSPPLVQFNLDRRSRALDAFQDAPGFIIHVLKDDQHSLSHRFSKQDAERWLELDHDQGAFGLPRLRDVHAVIECERHAVYEGGDHLMFIGHVLSVETNIDARPLVFYRGRYHQLAV